MMDALKQICDMTVERLGYQRGQEDALRYILRCVRVSCEFLPRPAAYVAAMDEVAVMCGASLERLSRGEAMEATSVTAE